MQVILQVLLRKKMVDVLNVLDLAQSSESVEVDGPRGRIVLTDDRRIQHRAVRPNYEVVPRHLWPEFLVFYSSLASSLL